MDEKLHKIADYELNGAYIFRSSISYLCPCVRRNPEGPWCSGCISLAKHGKWCICKGKDYVLRNYAECFGLLSESILKAGACGYLLERNQITFDADEHTGIAKDHNGTMAQILEGLVDSILEAIY